MVASVLAPFVTGLIIRSTGTMAPALYLAAAVLLMGALLSAVAARRVTSA